MILHLLKHGQSSHEFQNGRDAAGKLTQECVLCGYTRLVLAEDVVIGPAHTFKPDAGARTSLKAQRVPKDNVRTWKRSER